MKTCFENYEASLAPRTSRGCHTCSEIVACVQRTFSGRQSLAPTSPAIDPDQWTPVEIDELRATKPGPMVINKIADKASAAQIGGSHYKNFAIQPAQFCTVNKLGFLESSVIKRMCRWETKNGLEDLLKAKHEIDLLIEFRGLE